VLQSLPILRGSVTPALLAWIVGLALGCSDETAQQDGSVPMQSVDSGAEVDARTEAGADAGSDARVPGVGALPGLLSETGLYSDTAAGTLSPGVRAYEVNSPLWADTADKERFVWLPPDTRIDTSDMDQWVFPIGTKLWKSFEREGKRLETRLIEKQPSGSWEMVAYAWNEDQSDAIAVPDGVPNAGGTPHDIPEQVNCAWCHEGRADRVLGFTALQLSHDLPGPNLMRLAAEDLLTDPPAGPFAYPGDDVARPALQYLHANCGHCHNPTRTFALGCSYALGSTTSEQCNGIPDNPPRSRGQVVFFFWQSVHELGSLEETITYKSVVEPHDSFLWPEGIVERMRTRGGEQMPPVATKEIDPDGLAAVEAWVESLRPLFPDGETAAP
jgi:mono/diheme cytochrome c family protein